jgi:hypothetical protein
MRRGCGPAKARREGPAGARGRASCHTWQSKRHICGQATASKETPRRSAKDRALAAAPAAVRVGGVGGAGQPGQVLGVVLLHRCRPAPQYLAFKRRRTRQPQPQPQDRVDAAADSTSLPQPALAFVNRTQRRERTKETPCRSLAPHALAFLKEIPMRLGKLPRAFFYI